MEESKKEVEQMLKQPPSYEGLVCRIKKDKLQREKQHYAEEVNEIQNALKHIQTPVTVDDVRFIYDGLFRKQISLEMIPPEVLDDFRRSREHENPIEKRKDGLLESIENLNITALSDHLIDQYKYLGVSKPVFLEGLQMAFQQFLEKGDTYLEQHEAVCDSTMCSNRGSLGYVFRGNHSGNLLALLFEEVGEVCVGICQCLDFRPLDESVTDGPRISLDVNTANMTRNEVKELVKEVTAAFEELDQFQGEKVKWDFLQNWLERHENLQIEKLWSMNDDTLLDFTVFSDSLLSLKEYVDLIPTYTRAYKEFPGMEDEKALLKWLVRHHALHIKDMDFGYFDHLTDKNTLRGLEMDKEEFKIIEEFSSLSRKTYWPMLEKYTTFTEDDIPKEDESGNEIASLPGRPSSSEYWQNRDSLLYHLRKRKMV